MKMFNKINFVVLRKFVLGIFVFLFLMTGVSFGYNASVQDIANLNNLKGQLDNLIEDNNINLWDFYDQVKVLEISNTSDERLFYMLSNLKSYLYNKLFTSKTAAKIGLKNVKQGFVDTFGSGISVEIDDSLSTCTGWYNTLDDISFAYNLPTALTIAAWYRESTCAYYLPSNGDGPFQIINKDYGTGEMTEQKFIETVEDFLEFTKYKFARYDSKLSGYLTYTGFDMTGISNFAGLYNGGTKSGSIILPNNENYLFDGYGQEFSGATRYGILPQFIKVLNWEIENIY